MNDTILKAVLNKVAVWKQMYSDHDPTADEINDRNWLNMCVVLSDRIKELEAKLNLQDSVVRDVEARFKYAEAQLELEAEIESINHDSLYMERAETAEAQLDKVSPYIQHKPDCEIDDNAWYVDHDHQYACHCTCGLQQALENEHE